MNLVEVGKLLTIASGFDRFITVDRITTEVWHLVLKNVDYAEAQEACVAHFVGPHAKETFGVRHILDAVAHASRNTQAQIEADVRSAKARGLISKSHPESAPLPKEVQETLFGLRETERTAAKQRFELEQATGEPMDLGTVGRSI